MRTGLRTGALFVGLISLMTCRVEQRVPAGAASEGDRVREVVAAYYRSLAAEDEAGFLALFAEGATVHSDGDALRTAAEYWSAVRPRLASGTKPVEPRAARTQIRVQGALATAWVTTEWEAVGASSSGLPERALFLLMRDDTTWRLAAVGLDDGI